MDDLVDLTGARRLAVISDTHGLVRPQLYDLLDGVDAVLHAGDLGGDHIEIELRAIAPVYAVAGNVDGFTRSPHPRWRAFRIGDRRVGVTHIALSGSELLSSVLTWARQQMLDVLVYGHTHEPRVHRHDEHLLLFNPGSCGPRRFELPVTVGLLHVEPDGELRPEIVPVPSSG